MLSFHENYNHELTPPTDIYHIPKYRVITYLDKARQIVCINLLLEHATSWDIYWFKRVDMMVLVFQNEIYTIIFIESNEI